jgi:hypothetical protein
MYFIPIALFIKQYAPVKFFEAIQKTPADFPHLTWNNFFLVNLVPVTIGNIIGGAVMVGLMYWFIYMSKSGKATVTSDTAQRIAAATARPEVPAPIFYVTHQPPTRTAETPAMALGGQNERREAGGWQK